MRDLYQNASRSREQTAASIAAGHPSPVLYTAIRLRRWPDGHLRPEFATPVHLLRAPVKP